MQHIERKPMNKNLIDEILKDYSNGELEALAESCKHSLINQENIIHYKGLDVDLINYRNILNSIGEILPSIKY
jgi:hypothetical protein